MAQRAGGCHEQTRGGADLLVTSGRSAFLIKLKSNDHVASLDRARAQLTAAEAKPKDAVLVLAVPYMGPQAREYAKSKGLPGWAFLAMPTSRGAVCAS